MEGTASLAGMARLAQSFWPRMYAGLARVEPAIERVWRRAGFGNVVRVIVPGRRTGKPRPVFLGILRAGSGVYLGHPDVPCSWTRNLEAAGGGEIEYPSGRRRRFTATRLAPGPERDAAIGAAFRQHPFPGSLIYRLFGKHVREFGLFYRLEPARD